MLTRSAQTRYALPIEAVDTFRPRPVGAPVKEHEPEEYISPSQMPPEAVARMKEREAAQAKEAESKAGHA